MKLYLVMGFGVVATIIYLYLLLVEKSSLVHKPSKLVVFLLVFLALVGGLIRYSQIFDYELTYIHYLQMAQYALMLPSCAIGIGLLKVIITYGMGAMGAVFERKL